MSERKAPPVQGPRGGPAGGMFSPPPAKSKDFRGSLRRLLGHLRPERNQLTLVVSLTSVSVVLGAFGPKILGRATNYVFYGYLGRRIPVGVTKAQALARLRSSGQSRLAEMLQNSPVVPGQGVNFAAVGRVLHVAAGLSHGRHNATHRVSA
jgi:ATP-binding cassette subfamily B multidrug efflux pump